MLSLYQKGQAEASVQKALDILSSDGNERSNIVSALHETHFARNVTELMYENRIEERNEASATCMRSAMYKKIDLVVVRTNKMLAKEVAKEYQELGDNYNQRRDKLKARKAYDKAAYYANIAVQYSDGPRPIYKRHEGKDIEKLAIKSINKTTDGEYQQQLLHSMLTQQDSDRSVEEIWEEVNLNNFNEHKLLWQQPPSQEETKLV